MNYRLWLVGWLLPALFVAGCSARPAAENPPAGSSGGQPTASPVSVESTRTPTQAPSDTPVMAETSTAAPSLTATQTTPAEVATATPTGLGQADTPVPPSDTPVPASETPLPPTATPSLGPGTPVPPATQASDTTLPDTVVPPSPTFTASPTSSPVPPDSTEAPGQGAYVIYSEQVLGEYVARVWVRSDDLLPNMLSLGTIDRGSERLVQIKDVAGFEPLPAADMTGEGQLDVAFALRWGGSHCCSGTVLYNLGEAPQQVLWVGGEIGRGTFQDLDADGDWEFITRDRVTGVPCSQPSPLAVLAYSPAQGYAPASPQFPAVFEAEIVEYTHQAELRLQENGVRSQCDVADLMLDYLYSGQAERGWAEFARLYTEPDAADYKAALEAAAQDGQLYVEQ